MATSVQFTVGKLDAGMAILLTEEHHLIEFPSLLLPPGVSSGSIVNINVARNYEQESAQSRDFWSLQEAILKEFGENSSPGSDKIRNKLENLTDINICFELIEIIKRIGAKYEEHVGPDTTHLICNAQGGIEYQRAIEGNIPIVKPEWLVACEKADVWIDFNNLFGVLG
ncbi:1502_t:CDS:2 [Entrophospora sp. SA101]|nr:1173_t:CDS:2 [Entrophospora sp. SA101]CAJ0912698.1 1502_t:CDS:2 [Entrophospora sp. SA101]